MVHIDDLLREAKEASASDIHLAANQPPYFRIYGELKSVVDEPLKALDMDKMVKQLTASNKRAANLLVEKLQADLSYSIDDGTRFRVNIYNHSDGIAIALRLISSEVRSIEELGLPSHVLQFPEQKQGFVLCVGPTGEGKSTTLAAMIRHINEYRSEHIITIEDPIEYQFSNAKSIINQREIGKDAVSYPEAIRATLRQDPDVVLIGELRDRESMQTALTMAETGHLVLSTLHTNDAAQTVQRIIDSFPADQQSQIRSQLASTLSGVISQRLLPRKGGGLVPAVEVMLASTAIRSAIREDKPHQITGMIETSAELGMQTMAASITELVEDGTVEEEVARPYLLTSVPMTHSVKDK